MSFGWSLVKKKKKSEIFETRAKRLFCHVREISWEFFPVIYGKHKASSFVPVPKLMYVALQ